MTKIECDVCIHRCRLEEGAAGRCRARKNIGGKSVSINYGKITALALDPIEKKPLTRFYPGSMILSAGSFGCNMDCPFCQNDAISAVSEEQVRYSYIPPDELAGRAEEMAGDGCIGLAFTYNEPMIGFEYVRDAARESARCGMKNVVVTNGAVSQAALAEVLPWIDAWNIDLKGFSEDYYKKLGGDLSTVLEFIKTASRHAHVELTTLIVPHENDTEKEMSELSSWIAAVDRRIPLHITRFFPRRNMLGTAPTDIGLMHRLRETAARNLDIVFLGNV